MKINNIDVVYGMFFAPSDTAYLLSRSDLDLKSFSILFFFIISLVLSKAHVFNMSAKGFFYFLTWGGLAEFLFLLTVLMVFAAIYHVAASMYGATAKVSNFIKALPYTLLPLCLLYPLIHVFKILPSLLFWPFLMLIMLFLILWVEFLQLKMINYFYGLNSSKAILILVLPWILTAFAFVVVPIIFGAGMILRFS